MGENAQLRTIPISGALRGEGKIMPYEEARQIIANQEKIVVAPCICRREHRMAGQGCDRPMESCLVFGIGAQYYAENELGRTISQEEAFEILKQAEETGLVLQPSNAKNVVNICTCCGCCCQILKNLKKLPSPADYVASNYHAVLNEEECTGCSTCVDRCQMGAIEMQNEIASIRQERCIGCGLCVTTCPGEAILLELKPEEKRTAPPEHMRETYMRIAKERLAGEH